MPEPSLTEFLLARTAEDEAVALAATPSPWSWAIPAADFNIPETDAEHIKRWNPARVLAESETKRRIVAIHTGMHECTSEASDCNWITGDDCETLRFLALPYASHADYRKEWRP